MKEESRIIQVHDIDIGQNLKKLRQSRNMKQSEVLIKLQLLGVEIELYSYSKIENGKQNPTVRLLAALTEIFDCDYNAFFRK